MQDLKILFTSSEVNPFAKTGGLADVAGSLPKALKQLGTDIRVVLPKYKTIPQKYTEKMEYIGYTYVDMAWRHQYCGIFKLEHNKLICYFIDNEYYFKRDNLYGYFDEAERFTFFSKAVLQILPCIGFKPDIIHCNDWQTGIVSTLLKAHYRHLDYYRNVKTIFTIHNLKYQGVFPKSIMQELLGLDWRYFTSEYGLEFYDCVNFLKAGLIYSDIINTVSKTYAEEIKHDFFGENLNKVISRRSSDVYGIVNGIDYDENNPAKDTRIFANYDAEHTEGKAVNKKKLQESLGLPVNDSIPIIGVISRLVDQKGFDLIQYALHNILQEDIQLVVLGTGEARYENMFRRAAADYPQKVVSKIMYDGTLAQRIYAGCDMFLMPSLFEPCGLSQLFSLRYGTIPIVRETGGLNDTIRSFNDITGEGNGFSFTHYNADDMLYTVRRALSFYRKKDVWSHLVSNAMKEDYSWSKSAREYLDLYKIVVNGSF